METIVIKPADMMKKLNPHNKWQALGSKSWQQDYGLIQAFNQSRADIGTYFVREKSHKSLWDLFLNCSEQEVITSYYGFPKPAYLQQFLVFCYNHVAADYAWKDAKANDGKDQMDFFPYESLWKEFEEKVVKHIEERAQQMEKERNGAKVFLLSNNKMIKAKADELDSFRESYKDQILYEGVSVQECVQWLAKEKSKPTLV